MDAITDMASEAVSYITVMQDICRVNNIRLFKDKAGQGGKSFEAIKNSDHFFVTKKNESNKLICRRINEIVWSGNNSEKLEDLQNKKAVFFRNGQRLLAWLSNDINRQHLNQYPEKNTPDKWRHIIKKMLYANTATRLQLCEALYYIPAQLLYGLPSKKLSVYKQRLYQVYFFDGDADTTHDELDIKHQVSLLSKPDFEALKNFWHIPFKKNADAAQSVETRLSLLPKLLIDDMELLKELRQKKITLPFNSLYVCELNEIKEAREKRKQEISEAELGKFLPVPDIDYQHCSADPEKRAYEMELAGLAFSGGGIRSATFNLGVLQKLAEIGALTRFDYLSTVSGGGYLGSWYISWIKRDGSVKKVNDRLNRQISTDPLAEEVRPVRWLRMFSNYLSPNTSIMSSDAWTMGITWVRNTLINQTVLLLILITLMSFIRCLYVLWGQILKKEFFIDLSPKDKTVNITLAIILTGTFLLACGMRNYNQAYPPKNVFLFGKSSKLPLFIVIWAALSASLVSGWFTFYAADEILVDGFSTIWEVGAISSVGMIFIAVLGGYHRNDEQNITLYPGQKFWMLLAIVFFSIIASIAGIALLTGCYMILSPIDPGCDRLPTAFIFGLPLVLEAICITVVIRMGLMGNFFADERREWWGRMGAITHRFIFWWIIITFSALSLPEIAQSYFRNDLPEHYAIAGGWVGIVGYAVRLAYTSAKDGDKPNGKLQELKEIFIRIAPYLFMLGFLIIGAVTTNYVYKTIFSEIPYWLPVIILAVLTVFFSWCVGVNEFSLHDFYRNRLVRGYLAATRRRTEREKTANGFTGFDREDDLLLASFCAKHGYYGPFPLLNTSLNATTVSELDRQDRKAESFVFTPLFCGFDFNRTRSSSNMKSTVFDYGYRPTEEYSRKDGPQLGTVMAVSGAAVSPNMGYHSSAATAFLLTIFNVRLGRWIGNPRKEFWKRSEPRLGLGYLINDLIGKSDVDAEYVYLSDGGHFDNMGIYELVRRRCTYILLCDAEQDEKGICEGLANAIRRCRIDFGVEIAINVADVANKNTETKLCEAHIVKGSVRYPDRDAPGTIVYIKTAVTKDVTQADIREYFLKNPKFPQQSTGDQFFNEAQFESYRNLGYNSIKEMEALLPRPNLKKTGT